MSGIAAGAQYLQLPSVGLGPQALSVAQRIANSTRRMAALIDEVLDFAKGRLGGGLDLRFSEVQDAADALREVVAEHQLAHHEREIVANIEADHPVPCDRGPLQQLASNLLANALVHGAPDEPVRLSAKIDDASIVVPEAALPHIFTPFWRRSMSTARQGLGLGLFICSQIVKAHGGTLEVISTHDNGTTFAARLPLRGAGMSAGPSDDERSARG